MDGVEDVRVVLKGWGEMRRFDQGIDAPNIAFKKAKRKTPDHMGNVLIMLAGCTVATVIALVCLVMVFSDNPVFQAAGILGIVFVCSSMYVVLTNPAYWQTVETITGHDLDGDGVVGAPINEFNYRASEHTSWRASLPAPEPVLREWATIALNGGSLAYSAWYRKFSTRPDHKDGTDKYRAFRQALVGAEWALERGTHSIDLTDRGEQALGEWLAQNPDPTPLLEGQIGESVCVD